jgi:penicillin-binding protein 2
MHCWSVMEHFPPHGTLGLADALKESCDCFFYQYGNAAGIDQIDAMGAMLGFGQKSGIPLSAESPGLLPTPAWLAKISPQDRWSQGYTANTSIGQGAVLASPLQLAVMVAAVANGGTVYYPRLVEKVVAQDGAVTEEPSKVRTNLITDAGLTEQELDKVRKGLWKVVNESGGTACHIPKLPDGMQIAGKTGTAQNWSMKDGKRIKDDHAWFVGYAPFDKPRYAICVLVQGGKAGGGVAGPIAQKILADTFAMDKGKEPVIAKLTPAVGNFNQVENVDFSRAVPALTSGAPAPSDEDEHSSAEPAPDEKQAPQHASTQAAPDIRQESDARGKVQNQKHKPSPLEKFFNFFGGKSH